MALLSLSSDVLTQIEAVEGRTLDAKLTALLEAYLAVQLRACEEEITAFEIKYRCAFADFAAAWEQNAFPNKYDHRLERDYMEWEGLEAERQGWLERLKQLPQRDQVEARMSSLTYSFGKRRVGSTIL